MIIYNTIYIYNILSMCIIYICMHSYLCVCGVVWCVYVCVHVSVCMCNVHVCMSLYCMLIILPKTKKFGCV